jgi:hypothetical protein
MNLKDFKAKHSISGIQKLKEKQNETLLGILDTLVSGNSSCITSITDVYNDNEVTIEPNKNCNLLSYKKTYEHNYRNFGLKFEQTGNNIKLSVNSQPPTKKSTDDTTTTSGNTSNDFNIYRQVAKTFMGEELNEEINRIKKIIYNG